MSLTITVPDELEVALKQRAQADGMAPGEFIVRVLAKALVPPTDPLDAFIGRFETGIPDLAKRPEDYLAETYADRHETP